MKSFTLFAKNRTISAKWKATVWYTRAVREFVDFLEVGSGFVRVETHYCITFTRNYLRMLLVLFSGVLKLMMQSLSFRTQESCKMSDACP